MRLDNSTRGNAIFVEQLAGENQTNSQTDSMGEPQEQLKRRIEAIKKDSLSLKPLTQAIQQRAILKQPQATITESLVNTNQKSARETIIKAIQK